MITPKMQTPLAAALLAGLLAVPFAVPARTKLVTLPDRESMVAALDENGETLVYEERVIPLQQGTNLIDFSWQGVSIDAESVQLEFLSHPGDDAAATKMIATGFPPGENALTWQVFSPEARTERVRVSYILSGLPFISSYDLRMDAEETAGDLRHYVTLTNSSGEDLENATLRFRGMEDLERTMEAGETRRFAMGRVAELPIEKLYLVRPGYHSFRGDDGENVSMVYQVPGDQLPGDGPVARGKARIFGADGTGSSIFLGEDYLAAAAIEEQPQLTLGTVKDVTVERRLMEEQRTDEVLNNSNNVVKFDLVRRLRYTLENFKDEAVTIEIHEPMQRVDWEIGEITEDGVTAERRSIDMLVLKVEVPASTGDDPGEKTVDLVIEMSDLLPNRDRL